ncbi:MAG: hypothetical protein O2973_12200 [Gemmatimonadetes bacterium]|nr:hypothetical protein [Gemmatimonadota bacterium]
MVGISGLWMPIVLSAVAVFIVSSLIHMVLGWHKSENPAPPNADALGDAMRPFNLAPGEYSMPRAASMKDMSSPEFVAKMTKGPVVMFTVFPNGPMNMGRSLGLWFVYSIAIGVFTAYVTGRTHMIGDDYLSVFRVAGAVSFAAYGIGVWQNWIWWGRSLRGALTGTLDGLIYALVTAGMFGWLWPR